MDSEVGTGKHEDDEKGIDGHGAGRGRRSSLCLAQGEANQVKVLGQWALNEPEDWKEIQSENWAALPMPENPTESCEGADLTNGWVSAVWLKVGQVQ